MICGTSHVTNGCSGAISIMNGIYCTWNEQPINKELCEMGKLPHKLVYWNHIRAVHLREHSWAANINFIRQSVKAQGK